MNNKKYMALFVLLFITLLSCAVITAADTTNNVTAEKTVSTDTITQKAVQTDKNVKSINNDKTKTIEKKVENNKKKATEEVGADDYTALYNYVNEAKTSENEYIIKLTGNTDLYTITSPIVWNPQTPKLLTINGNGKTIDSDDSHFLTIAQGSSVTINNLTVKNAKATNGGAIYNSGTLVVGNSTFVDNSVTKKGGAIYSEGTLTVTNSTFNNNKVTEGKNSADDGGVAIFTKGKLVVKDSTFEGNVAKYVDDSTSSDGGNGGAIQALDSTEDFIILDSSFKNNEGRHGGAIIILDNQYRNLGNKTIAGCNFTGNKATYGGAIETYANTNISNCKFVENGVGGYGNAGTNSPSGGAILINGGTYSNEVNIKECEFEKNSAFNQYTNEAGQGAAVYIYSQDSDVSFDTCQFTENSAYTGGTIYVRKLESDLTVKDSTFTGNTVVTDGVTISPLGSITVENVQINGINVAGIDETGNLNTNVADYEALYSLIETIKNSGMTENITVTLTGTDYNETQPIVIDSTFKPELLTINGNGKIIDANEMQFLTIDAGKNVTLNNLTIKDAVANQAGAAVFNFGNLSVNAVTFYNNTIKGDVLSAGAAIYSEGNVTVNNSEFKEDIIGDGSVGGYGAAIYTEGPLYVYNSVFNLTRIESENVASGGAIAVYGSVYDFIVDNSTFAGCFARHGGAILIMDIEGRNQGNKIINNCTFGDNQAIYGGAIETFNDLIIENSSFKENQVAGIGSGDRNPLGGAICVNNMVNSGTPGSITVRNTTFIENYAPTSATDESLAGAGGAIYNAGPNSVVDNCTFTINSAASGGALYNTQKLTVKNSNFTDNDAPDGSVVRQSGELILDNSLINNNFVGADGYVISNNAATSITFTNNNITHEGANLINTDVETKVSQGNKYAKDNVVVEISPIIDVTLLDTEANTNIPVAMTIDEIYGITTIENAQIKVTVNNDAENPYFFDVEGTGSTITIPVSDLSNENSVVVELVPKNTEDGDIYTTIPESVSFNIYKIITTQLTVNAANIYTGGNVNISGTLEKDGQGVDGVKIILTVDDGIDTQTFEVTTTNGYFEFTGLSFDSAAPEIVVTAKVSQEGYDETTAMTDFAVLERPPVIPTTITVDDIVGELQVNDLVTLTANVKDDLGNPVDEGVIIFKINGKTLRNDEGNVIYVTVDDGIAQLENVPVTQEWTKENSEIKAYYVGSDDYGISVSTTIPVTVVKKTAVVSISNIQGVAGQEITIKATVTSNDEPVTVGRVAVKIDGKTLKDSTGKALYATVEEITQGVTYTLPAKIKAGEHTITVVFTDTTFDRAEGSAVLTVSKQ